jgi:hypothetical protein
MGWRSSSVISGTPSVSAAVHMLVQLIGTSGLFWHTRQVSADYFIGHSAAPGLYDNRLYPRCGIVLKLWFRHPRTFPGYVSSRVKGANLGHRQNCRTVEAGKSATRPSYRSARWIGLTKGRCPEGAGNRSAAGRTARNEARRHDARGPKAPLSGDEKTLGGAQKEGSLRAASLPRVLSKRSRNSR